MWVRKDYCFFFWSPPELIRLTIVRNSECNLMGMLFGGLIWNQLPWESWETLCKSSIHSLIHPFNVVLSTYSITGPALDSGDWVEMIIGNKTTKSSKVSGKRCLKERSTLSRGGKGGSMLIWRETAGRPDFTPVSHEVQFCVFWAGQQ